MEQELRFGPVGINEKKDLAQLWTTFYVGFFKFSWAKKKIKNIVDSENIFGIEWSKKNIFFFLKKPKKI